MWFRRSSHADPRAVDEEYSIVCQGIVKDFGRGQSEVRVLHGIDIAFKAGATTFLVGPSGCGKTTLISILAGLLTPTAGAVQILGKSIWKLRKSQLVDFRASHLGFIFQQFNLIPALTAAENAAVSLVVQGSTLAHAKRVSYELLDRLGLGASKNKYPNQLSGGQQQRVAIARALAHQPSIVICDEPTASLDADTGHAVMELLQSVASDGQRTVVVVTHDSRIYPFADYIATMADGRILSMEQRK
ncbi:MAG: ABC transporter ATP-binding protein [Pirellula sp.]|jgi:putative ABC transport system ATP-binding protein|nr:ABC transporter ATP-binding protein [Pirellula sp.]